MRTNQLNEEQMQYLVKHYSNTYNDVLSDKLHVSRTTIKRYANLLGLKKGKALLKRRSQEGMATVRAIYKTVGRPFEKGVGGNSNPKSRFKPGHKQSAATIKLRTERAHITRNNTIAKEKWRVEHGLPQVTKMHITNRHRSYWQEKHYLKNRGYFISQCGDYAEWDDETRRSPRLEVGSRNFKFRKHRA